MELFALEHNMDLIDTVCGDGSLLIELSVDELRSLSWIQYPDVASSETDSPLKSHDLHHLYLQIRHFPVYKLLQRPCKSVTTSEWSFAIREMMLLQALERLECVDKLGGSVSDGHVPIHFRRQKSHWDFLMEEIQWMSVDFGMERCWKLERAREFAVNIQKGLTGNNLTSGHLEISSMETMPCVYGPPNPLITIRKEPVALVQLWGESKSGLFGLFGPRKQDAVRRLPHPIKRKRVKNLHVLQWSPAEDELLLKAEGEFRSSVNWNYVADLINIHHHHSNKIRSIEALRIRYEKLMGSAESKISEDWKKTWISKRIEHLHICFGAMKKQLGPRTIASHKLSKIVCHPSHEMILGQIDPNLIFPEELVADRIRSQSTQTI